MVAAEDVGDLVAEGEAAPGALVGRQPERVGRRVEEGHTAGVQIVAGQEKANVGRVQDVLHRIWKMKKE